MKKYTIILLLIFSSLTTFPSLAQQRTLEQMQDIANSVLQTKIRKAKHAGVYYNENSTNPILLQQTEELALLGYKTGGFVIVSKDISNEPILGFSESAVSDTLPEGYAWWLEAMTNSLSRKNVKHKTKINSSVVIDPLIQTKWGQSSPYNNLLTYKLDGKSYTFVTGCVATAMAQLLKYYEYPSIGEGSNKYYIKYSNLTDTLWLESNFSEHTYDYKNMLNSYSYWGSETQAQKDAVCSFLILVDYLCS